MVGNFRKIVKFKYKDKNYQMFMDRSNKLAFLEINNDKYSYPDLRAVFELAQIFYHSQNVRYIKSNKIKKYSFIPKVIYSGIPFILSISFLTACQDKTSINTNNFSAIDSIQTEVQEQSSETTTEDTESKYLNLLAVADDELDYMYASDYENFSMVKIINARDAKSYQEIFGYSNVSVEQIEQALNKNNSIEPKYKEFILNYVKDWLASFPNSDFSVLYTNINNNLCIKEVNEDEMLQLSLSTDTVACYRKEENTIYVLNNINLDKTSDDYIILTHELTHAARITKFVNNEGYTIRTNFFDETTMGLYSDEAIITCLAYQLQGLGNKSNFYTLQSSYYRIILDAIDYDGADYLNHSVNYLIDKMDEYMGDEEYAYHIISLIDAEASLRYTDYLEVDYHEFDKLYSYITRMYMKKHITSGMSYEDALKVYDDLMNEITYYFDKMKEPYDIDYDVFKNTFEEELVNYGINAEIKAGGPHV